MKQGKQRRRCSVWHFVSRMILVGCFAMAVFAGLGLLLPTTSHAAPAPPNKMNFQGRLTDASGNPLSGTYDMQFKLYSAATGGTLLWAETRTAANTNAVTVTSGLFSVRLGEGTLVAPSTQLNAVVAANAALYFEITIGADAAMTPRSQLATSAYAFNSDTLDGLDSTAFAAATGGTGYIQNQNASVQSAANFWINGAARADTSVLSPLLDTATATTLSIGTSNATAINLNQNVTVASGKSLTLAGGATANRPASPTEGMMWYDTATKQLLIYSNGKWQSDRNTSTKIVAASNASQALKDGADYVATGTGDQAQINAALTAAAGGKVYLTEGTYTINGSISVPNNTTLAGAGVGTVITIPNSLNTSINAITNTTTGGSGTGISIQDLRLEGNRTNQTDGSMNGIYFSGVGSSTTQGGKITNVWSNSWYGDSGAGIRLVTSSNNTITNNSFSSGTQGIYLTNSSNNNIITNNTTSSSSNGIYLSASSNNTITSNVSQNNGYGVLLYNSSNTNIVSNNRLVDNGGTSSNNAVLVTSSDGNTITGNNITDTSATTTNYVINITDASSDNNYLSNNNFNTGTINDLGTGTVYANQTRYGGVKLTNRSVNDTEAFAVQNAAGSNVLAVDTANNQVVVGNATTAGKLVISDAASHNVTLTSATQTGNYTLTIPALTGNAEVCTSLNNCGASLNTNDFIQNQNASLQTANFRISGTGSAATLSGTTSVTTPLLDTISGAALNIGTNNATAINLNQDTTIAAGKTLTIAGGTSRPSNPTEGMMFYGTTSKQLLIYSNGKWQSDRTTSTKIVAANDSPQAAKDGADYYADGTADQVEINEALAAAAGGKVYLMEGTYTINGSISVPNNTTLAGAGYGTVITVPNSFNTDINAIVNTTTGGNGTGLVIQDLRLEGNRDNQTSGTMNGIYWNGVGSAASNITGGKIANVWSNNWLGDNTAGILLLNSANNTITNTVTKRNYAVGIYLNGSSSKYNTLTGNLSQNNGMGFDLSVATNNTLTGNTATDNSYGFYLQSNSDKNTLSGNTIYGSYNAGILLTNTSNYNTISGNNLANSGGGAYNNAIRLNLSSSNNTITSNTISDSSATTLNYAINILDSGSTANYLADNTLGGGTVNDAGTGTIYGGQSNGTTYNIQPAQNIVMGSTTTVTNLQGAVGVGTGTPYAALDVRGQTEKTGTGTITSDSVTGNVTGTGTAFTTELHSGDAVCVGTNCMVVGRVSSDTLFGGSGSVFSPAVTNAAFTYKQSALRVVSSTRASGITIQGNSVATEKLIVGYKSDGNYAFYIDGGGGGVFSGGIQSNSGLFNSAGGINLNLRSGGASSGTTGSATLQSGDGTGASTNTGNVVIKSGNSTTSGNTGSISIDSGVATSGTNGAISIGTGNASSVTIGRSGTTTTIAGSTALTPQTSTSTTLLCSNGGILSTCDSSVIAPTLSNFIRNSSTQQTSANFNISGTGQAATFQASTSVLSALYDTVSAGTLSVGTSTATGITLGKAGVATTNSGSLTVTQGLTGNAGATINGAAVSLNASSNYATSINTGSSTGTVSIGNAAAGAIALQSASSIGLTGTTSITGLTSGNALTVSNATSTGAILTLNDNATTVFTVADGGTVLAKNTADSTTAFQIQNASSVSLFTVDTSNARLVIGPAAGDTVGTLLVLGNKTNAGDPTGVEGAMYYNSSMKSFRCYRDGAWWSCGEHNIDSEWVAEDDFLSGNSMDGDSMSNQDGDWVHSSQTWNFMKIGSAGTGGLQFNASVTGLTNYGDHTGLVVFDSTSSNIGSNLTLGSDVDGNMSTTQNTTFKTLVHNSHSTGFMERFGLFDYKSDRVAPASGSWWEGDPATSSYWRYCYHNTSTQVCANSTVPLTQTSGTDGWTKLEIRTGTVATTGNVSNIAFYINGSLAANITGVNIQKNTHDALNITFYSTNTTNKQLAVDYIQARGAVSR